MERNTSTKTTNRIEYIDGLKGIACIGVLLSHYWLSFYAFSKIDLPLNPFIRFLFKYPLSFFMNGNLMVCLFSIVSGYLMSKSRINNYRDLLKKMLKRYFRFAVPLFIICLIVFLISKTIGFHVQEVAALQSNDWLATFYKRDLSLKRVFIDSFIRILFFKSVLFAGPFWMLSELFIASLFLLVCNYIRTKSNLLVALVFFLMAIAMMIRGSYVIVSCLLGYCISFYHSKLLKISSKTGERSLIGLLLVVILLACTHSLICNYFGKFISVPRIFSINGWWNTVYAAIFFVLVSSIHSLQNILSSAVIKYSGEISFEIYCLHWPVLCSLGALLFLKIYPASYNAAFIITLICVLFATLGASILYNKTLGKVSTFIINRI